MVYVSALKLEQEVRPEQVAVAEKTGRIRLDDANAFNLFGTRKAHVDRKLGVMARLLFPIVAIDECCFQGGADERMSCAVQIWSNAEAPTLDKNLPCFV